MSGTRKLIILICIVMLPLCSRADVKAQVAYMPFIYGPVKPTDRLWRIAKRLRPSNRITIQQMMLAILTKNKPAFTQNNVNSLEAGAMLYLPSLMEIQALAAEHAERLIAHQNRLWHAAPSKRKNVISKNKAQNNIVQPVVLKTAKVDNLNQRLIDAQHDILDLKSLINKRFKTIEMQNQQLENQVKQESLLLSSLTKHVTDVGKAVKNKQARQNWVQVRQADILFFSNVTALILAGLLVIVSTWGRKKQSVVVSHDQVDTSSPRGIHSNLNDKGRDEEEYDYWGSREGSLAKLDLARAYIDMGETTQAKDILQEVIQKGSDLQKKEADRLLSDLGSDKTH